MIIIIILQGRKMNFVKSTPPQKGVIVYWSPETRKRLELNRLVLYHHHHHHHHRRRRRRPHIITHDRQYVGSKLLSILLWAAKTCMVTAKSLTQ
jgi:hypothetical protein